MKLSSSGEFLASYPFGWDDTPAVFVHDGTYSIITKDNHYNLGSYCPFEEFCPADRNATNPASPEGYFTRLNSNLEPEWSFQSTNTFSWSAKTTSPHHAPRGAAPRRRLPFMAAAKPTSSVWCLSFLERELPLLQEDE